MRWLLVALLCSGCAATLGGEDAWLDVEIGGSRTATREIERRITVYPDGRVVTDEGILEETAEADGLSEQGRALITAPARAALPF